MKATRSASLGPQQRPLTGNRPKSNFLSGDVRKQIAANERRARELIEAGFDRERQSDYSGAIEKYQAALQIAPNDRVQQRIGELRTQMADARQAEEQARLAAEQQRREAEAARREQQRLEQQRQQDVRRAAEQREQEAQARRQAEQQRARQEQARREAERERETRAAPHRNLTGTYVTEWSDEVHHGQQVHRYTARWVMRLEQQGNQVTGQASLYEVGTNRSDTETLRGTVRGNRLIITHRDGEADYPLTLTISSDFQTLTLREDGETMIFRRE